MKVGSSDKYDRLSHQLFASSLRNGTVLSSRTSETPSTKYVQWVDGIIPALLCSNNKVDIMRIMKLEKLHECEVDFLKSAVSPLSYASGPYHADTRESIVLLKRWAGYPVTDPGRVDSCKEVHLSRTAFKNTLLKLFMNKTKDYRVVQMRGFLDGCPPATSAIEMYNKDVKRSGIKSTNSILWKDTEECQTHTEVKTGKIAKARKFLPEYEYSPKTTVGKLKHILDLPPTRRNSSIKNDHASMKDRTNNIPQNLATYGLIQS